MTPRRHQYTLTAPGPSANPYVAPTPTPTSTPTPTPQSTIDPWANAKIANDMNMYWRQRSGADVYKIFKQIQAENPMAARAFWDASVGTGGGMNDLVDQTIQNEFGGDMNAYNNWRNLYHYTNMDYAAGNFDLNTGKWTPGQGFNPQYVKDQLGWNVQGPWQASWDWSKYLNGGIPAQGTFGPSKNYGTPEFSNQGVTYVPNGPNAGVKPNVNAIKGPGTPIENPYLQGFTPAAVGPGITQGTSSGVINREPVGGTVTNPYASHSRDNVLNNPYSQQTDVNIQPITGTPMSKPEVQQKSNPYFFRYPEKRMQGWR